MGAVKVAETGMADASIVGMAETGAIEVAGVVAIGTPISVATSCSLKVSAIRRMNMLSKRKTAARG